jgi:uncharacterized protein
MLARQVQPALLARLASYPAVALIGPRQCGKTTLALSLGGDFLKLNRYTEGHWPSWKKPLDLRTRRMDTTRPTFCPVEGHSCELAANGSFGSD